MITRTDPENTAGSGTSVLLFTLVTMLLPLVAWAAMTQVPVPTAIHGYLAAMTQVPVP